MSIRHIRTMDQFAHTTTSKAPINDLATILNKNPDTDLKIEGHTDNTGTAAYNQTLSEKRAASVASYLKSQGISGTRMATIGYGESQPVADNNTLDGRAQNRRVTFVIIANEKMKADAQKEAATK